MLQTTQDIPIVFVHVPDPVGAGFVDNLARPGGNASGFLLFEYGISAKWLAQARGDGCGLRPFLVSLHS
jgi:putative ABC transport system substrate-binding protein